VQVTRAVITAAGRGARQYPASDTVQKAMLPLVDRDGLTKPLLQIIAEEAIESGIEDLCVVCAPGDEPHFRHQLQNSADTLREGFRAVPWAIEQARRLGELEGRLTFVEQPEPEGYGHAVWCARGFVRDQPFLLLLGDHLYISRADRRCARQLLDLAVEEQCAVSAVQATREHLIHQYGTVVGKRIHGRSNAYAIEAVVEQPDPTLAELRLQVPGLRAGHYLCFFGMHLLTPGLMELLDEAVATNQRESGQIQLTPSLNQLANRERYLALETQGTRHNLGVKFGQVDAQIALALAGVDREQILSLVLESVARVERHAGP
jgi:UTP--glucose-1-phosphate uridylyltransferase